MKSSKIPILILIFLLVAGCGGGGSGGSSSSPSASTPPPAQAAENVLLVTVNGSLCSNNPSIINKACVSVTVCTPGTTNCQTITDILLDTGSSGLRIFKQVLSVPLPQVASGSGSLTECIQFADNTSDWGPVQTASVILANEPAVQIPIQVIDSTFGTPTQCGIPHQNPTDAGYNGILGVGLFVQDCGPGCTSSPSNGVYYSCVASTCTGTAVALTSQVQNPVALLPQDNNGVIVQLPGVPSGGAPSVNGSLVLGIGTRSNNAPSGVAAYTVNQVGEFSTTFNATSYVGILDTGSNGLFFNPPPATTGQLPNCPGGNAVWFCPSTTLDLSATNTGASGSPSGTVPFQIGNFESLFTSPGSNKVFNDIGGRTPGSLFDWGLPFFLGRNVFAGIEGKGSGLGTGPYWAY